MVRNSILKVVFFERRLEARTSTMTEKQLVILVGAVLLVGIVLPVSYAIRIGLFLALAALVAIVLIGGGTQYLIGMFD